MINKIYFYESKSYNPYENLALEEYFIRSCEPDTLIVYLWQNDKTVVIGKNQNSFRECNIAAMNSDGASLARRQSGGGAVYHDKGNLNFSFIAHKEDYSVDRHLEVVMSAVRSFGIGVEKSGRNDILADGRKFSGNAFFLGSVCCHHGTILVNCDLMKMSAYLNVSESKLKVKGVASVRSRVCNLMDLCPEIKLNDLKQKLIESVHTVYSKKSIFIPESEIDFRQHQLLTAKYASDEWRFGKGFQTNRVISKRFLWGEIEICLKISEGIVKDCVIFTDAMDCNFTGILAQALKGTTDTPECLSDSVSYALQDNSLRSDIMSLFEKNSKWGG